MSTLASSQKFPTELPVFAPHRMLPQDGCVILIAGDPGSGKTTAAKNLFPALATRISQGYMFCTTKQGYHRWFPTSFIKNAEQPIVDEYTGYMRQMQAADADYAEEYGTPRHRALLYFDDCGHLKRTFQTETIERDAFTELLISHRHYGVYIIACLQAMRQASEKVYNMAKYIILTGTGNARDMDRIRTIFFSRMSAPVFEDFLRYWVSTEIIERKQGGRTVRFMRKLVLNTETRTMFQWPILLDDDLPEFSMCSRDWWEMHYAIQRGRKSQGSVIDRVRAAVNARANVQGQGQR